MKEKKRSGAVFQSSGFKKASGDKMFYSYLSVKDVLGKDGGEVIARFKKLG